MWWQFDRKRNVVYTGVDAILFVCCCCYYCMAVCVCVYISLSLLFGVVVESSSCNTELQKYKIRCLRRSAFADV